MAEIPLTVEEFPALATTRFRLTRLLARGGTGHVFEAVDLSDGRAVAVKIPRGRSLHERDAFRRELAALHRLSRLGHHGIAQVVEAGPQHEVPWYAMTFIEGVHLGQVRSELWPAHESDEPATLPTSRSGFDGFGSRTEDDRITGTHRVLQATQSPGRALPPAAGGRLELVLRLGLEIARTLAWVHARGVVHGDVTPRNIILRADGVPVLVDFGSAFLAQAGGGGRELPYVASEMATPAYRAPERARSEPLDARADIYALGCILYELVTNQRPTVRERESSNDQAEWRAASSVVSGVSPELDDLLDAMMASDPADRLGHMREVEAALVRLVGHAAPTLPTNDDTAPILYRSRLVGRERELRALVDFTRTAAGGAGGLAVVRGDAGSGKTRLINEMTSWANRFRGRVVASHYTDAAPAPEDGAPDARALSGFHSLFEVISDARPARAVPVDDELSDAWALLAPYSQGALGPSARKLSALGEARGSLMDALVTLIAWTARRAPLLLVFDDLQWADELTLYALQHCPPYLAGLPVAFVCAFRGDVPMPSLEAIARVASVDLALGRLRDDAMARLTAESLGARRLPEELCAYVVRNADGNPYLASEYLRGALATGALTLRESGAWTFEPRAAEVASRPIEDVFAARLARLSSDAIDVLSLACLLERELDVGHIAALPSPLVHSIDEALHELVAAQLLEWVGPTRYRFVHESLRQLYERTLSPLRVTTLHRAIATWLAAEPHADAEQLARHWARGGCPAIAAPLLVQCARGAAQAHAPRRAAELYRMALAASALDAALAGVVAGVREELGDALSVQGEHRQAIAEYLGCLHAADAPLERARLLRKQATSHWTLHEYGDAEECEQAALAAMGEPDPSRPELRVELVELALNRLERLYFSRDIAGAERLTAELAPQVIAHGTPSQRCHFGIGAACELFSRRGYGPDEQALGLARLALPAQDSEVPLSMRAHAHFVMGFVLIPGSPHDRREALAWFEEAHAEARRAGDRVLLARISTYQALTALRMRDVAAAAGFAASALEAAERVSLTPYVAAALSYQGWVAAQCGQQRRATSLLDKALELWNAHPHAYPFQWSGVFPRLGLRLPPALEEQRTLLARVLHASQQRLPEPLRARIEEALADEGAALGNPGVLAGIVEQAQTYAFC